MRHDFLETPDGFLRRMSAVTAREIVIRIYIYLNAVSVPYCTLRLAHSLAAIVAVLCGDSPARWPPLFGRLRDAYTIRRFWS